MKAIVKRPIVMVRSFARLYGFQKLSKKRLIGMVAKVTMSLTRRLIAKNTEIQVKQCFSCVLPTIRMSMRR